ncbi:hypothetical protein DET65_2338 [Sunxiuqinia elliptica]|uniref:Uncharacterized protein n=1 Tax=Sunxiuqinia elliptica TaxID=655355 RepID=A0A4R6GUT6_9BACT|nr:hypothetical protein DET52_108213 [Sunxiuqinia elliptica]TDO60528.1 hypothetical protein DET65_2338 [Sunxiuqinia elliptica]
MFLEPNLDLKKTIQYAHKKENSFLQNIRKQHSEGYLLRVFGIKV